MIHHRGFHFASFGMWDPRCDALFLEQDEIRRFAKDIGVGVETFQWQVVMHELSQRRYYTFPAVLTIGSRNMVFEDTILTRSIRGYASSRSIEIEGLRRELDNSNQLLDELDPVFDAMYSIGMLGRLVLKKAPDADSVSKAIAGLIANEKTRRLFELLIPVSKAFRWNYRVINVLAYLAAGGDSTTMKSSKGEMISISPYATFSEFAEILSTIVEAGKLESSGVGNIIRKAVSSDEFVDLGPMSIEFFKKMWYYGGTEVRKIWQDLFVKKKELETEHKLRKAFYERITGKRLKRYEMDGRPRVEYPGIGVMHSEGSYNFSFKKELQEKMKPPLLSALASSHMQDCLWSGRQIECIFCELGICKMMPGVSETTHDLVKVVETLFYKSSDDAFISLKYSAS